VLHGRKIVGLMRIAQLVSREGSYRRHEPAISTPCAVATRQRRRQRESVPVMPKKILVVDDHHHSREGLKDSLSGEGHEVEAAADCWQAITKLKKKRFEVAIIDLDLPPAHGVDMTGWDLIRICRAFHPAITVIVVGAEVSQGVKARADELKVSNVLEKPIYPTQLKAIVRALNL
jgi:CheY-like chemotaxis protein